MRFFLIPHSQKPANTVPICSACMTLPVESILGRLVLSPEEAAYVLQRKGQTYLDTFRIGG